MKVVWFLRNVRFLHVLFRTIKPEALAMNNHWQPNVACPTLSESSSPHGFTAGNLNAGESFQNHLPRLNGHTTTASSQIPQLYTASSSSMEYEPTAKAENNLEYEDNVASSVEAPAKSDPAGKRRRSELGGIEFKLSGCCILALSQGDITKWHVDGTTDAIVNAANERMLGGGGVDGAIHRAAGPRLLKACRNLPLNSDGVRCPVGSAVATEGFNLPVSRIIHTVGPVYKYEDDKGSILRKAYESSFTLAVKHGIKYIAFPAISCGIYRYPADKAAEVALKAVDDWSGLFKEIHFVLFETMTWNAWLSKAQEHFERFED